MLITSLRKPGNRRSENDTTSGVAPASASPVTFNPLSAKPKISDQEFVYPGKPVLSNLPSIKNVVETPIVNTTMVTTIPESEGQQRVKASNEPVAPQITEVPAIEPAPVDEPVVEPIVVKQENFEDCWKQMVDEMLSHNAILSYTLNKYIPKYENDTIIVELSNPFQSEELQKRIRSLVEYWRCHFKLNLDDIEVKVVEDLNRSEAILNTDDQFRKMKEDNPELLDFLSVMQMRIKD